VSTATAAAAPLSLASRPTRLGHHHLARPRRRFSISPKVTREAPHSNAPATPTRAHHYEEVVIVIDAGGFEDVTTATPTSSRSTAHVHVQRAVPALGTTSGKRNLITVSAGIVAAIRASAFFDAEILQAARRGPGGAGDAAHAGEDPHSTGDGAAAAYKDTMVFGGPRRRGTVADTDNAKLVTGASTITATSRSSPSPPVFTTIVRHLPLLFDHPVRADYNYILVSATALPRSARA
jgi:hypothetical protein